MISKVIIPFTLSWVLVLVGFLLPNLVKAGGCFGTDINGTCFKWDTSQPIVWNPDPGCLKCGLGNFDQELGDAQLSGEKGSGGSCQLIEKEEAANTDIDNATARAMITAAFQKWMSVPGAKLIVQEGPALPEDANLATYTNYYIPDSKYNPNDPEHPLILYNPKHPLIKGCYDSDPNTPCYNPVIFDPNGLIMQDLIGPCNQYTVYGLGGIMPRDGFKDPILKKGQFIINAACMASSTVFPGCEDGGGCSRILSKTDIEAVMVHELGHFLGMDHTQVAPESAWLCSGLPNGCTGDLKDDIPTMYDRLIQNGGQETLHIDDKVAFAKLYPDPDPANQTFKKQDCTIKGSAWHNGSYLRCAEILAVPVSGALDGESFDYANAVSVISGAEAPKIDVSHRDQWNCSKAGGQCSKFEISGIKVGQTYRLQIHPIYDWKTSIEPCYPALDSQGQVMHEVPNIQPNLDAYEFTCNEAGKVLTVGYINAK
ncbi:MAG: hypothetical protein HYU97_05810 [Deltaproteobacteria bacterium]|nr:hypothetical protein [Deltaproteobacteria bacterium]